MRVLRPKVLPDGSRLIWVQLPAHLISAREEAVSFAEVLSDFPLRNTQFVR